MVIQEKIFLCLVIFFSATSLAASVCEKKLDFTKVVIREHRGGLKESMNTASEINRTLPALAAYVSSKLGRFINTSDIIVKPYTWLDDQMGWDERIGWDTYLIMVEGLPWGFSNGPIPKIVN